MAGISAMSGGRGGEGCCQPLGVDTRPSNGMPEGDTGAAPLVVSWCDARPVCHSWENMCPPLAWTAATTFCQPAICSSEYSPGAPNHPRPEIEIVVASEMMSPPSEARCP